MRDVISLARQQENWRLKRCINLIPSENVTSPQVRALLASDFGHRYSLPIHGTIHGVRMENAYHGTRYLDQVEAMGEELARELFDADCASLKPLSGHISGLITILATCQRGDRMMVVDPVDGGYDGYGPEYLPGMLGVDVEYLPYAASQWNIRTEEAATKVEEVEPSLVLVGASFLLFPYDLRPLRKACDSVGSVLAYDGSHVLGLVAGRSFQRPLVEGADILLGSTHKSFFGPQGGLIVARKGLEERLTKSVTWKALDNAHWNRIAALTQALAEMKEFGKAYAEMVVSNAQRLARELDSQSVPVRFREMGYTRSPQLLLDGEAIHHELGMTLPALGVVLERSNIIVDSVGRLGTNEITRMGAKEEDMSHIAELVSTCVRGENVSKEVVEFAKGLKLSYVFDGD